MNKDQLGQQRRELAPGTVRLPTLCGIPYIVRHRANSAPQPIPYGPHGARDPPDVLHDPQRD